MPQDLEARLSAQTERTTALFWNRRPWVVGAALAATAIFFHRAAFSADVFIGRDVLRGVYPLKAYWAQRVGAGELPQWFPYDGLGQPFVGMMVSAVFHPSNLLFLVFDLGLAQKLATLGCYPVAFLGVVAWLRRFGVGPAAAAVGGIAFTCNGYLVGISNNVPYLMGAATLPWVLWAFDRFLALPTVRGAVLPAGALSLVLYAGEPQTFAVGCGVCLLVPLSRPEWRTARSFAAAAATVALAAFLAAPLLIPAVRLLPDITAGARSIDVAQTWSVHPLQVFEIALGALFGGSPDGAAGTAICRDLLKLDKGAPWVESMHLGLPALLLAGVALAVHRRTLAARVLAAALAFLVLMMLGKHAGVYGVVFDLFPPWRPFRYPVKLLPFFALIIALGAAFGFDAIARDPRVRRHTAIAFLVAAVACLLAWGAEASGGLLTHGLGPVWAAAPSADVVERLSGALGTALAQTALAAVVMCLALAGVSDARLRAGLVALVVAAHLFAVNEPHYQVGNPALLTTVPQLVEQIRAVEGPPKPGVLRVADVLDGSTLVADPTLSWSEKTALFATQALASDTQQLWGLEGANNSMPATSSRYAALCKQKDLWLWRYAPLFNTRYVSIRSETFRKVGGDPGEVVLAEPVLGLSLVRKAQARPRAYVARARCVADGPAALAALGGPAELAPTDALVECDDAGDAAADVRGDVSVDAYAPERVALTASVRVASTLVLNDAWYQGWTATVDGAPVPILHANYAVRAVRLGPGPHAIVFEYRTPGLALGFAAAALALVVVLGTGPLRAWRRRATAAR